MIKLSHAFPYFLSFLVVLIHGRNRPLFSLVITFFFEMVLTPFFCCFIDVLFLLYVFTIAHFYGCCVRLALFASSINVISCTPITFCIVGSTFPYAVNHGSNINIVRHSIIKVCQTCGLLRYGLTSAPFCFRLSILRLDKTYINI